VRAFRIADWALRGQLVCTHIGFILLNMATMPFWQIEGLILYALLCGYTYYSASTVRDPVRAPIEQAGRPTYVANPYMRRRAG
jgi:Ca2+/Na+ antiporter